MALSAIQYAPPSAAASVIIDFDPAITSGGLVLVVGDVNNPLGAQPTVTFDLGTTPVGGGTAIVGTPAIQIEMAARRFGNSNTTAQLLAQVPAGLGTPPNQIPINAITWTSALPTGAPGGMVLIASGQFSGPGTQTIHTLPVQGNVNRYAGAVMTFSYANTQAFPGGTYSGVVRYTATMPQ
ncbi:MAG TPA: hypothetical protein DIC36_03305 [Gammaproteobacteria bacterium]|nr:hypothetical protein [Gammaproteobacteria bacterium]